jgi:prevent-host-death family protein
MCYMEATVREFKQNASRVFAAAERGETVTVFRNGRPIARVVPIEVKNVPPYPTDPIGDDLDLPVFGEPGDMAPVDWSKGRERYLKGFGA